MENPKELDDLYVEFKELAKENSFFLNDLKLNEEAKVRIQSMLLNIVRRCGELEKEENWKLLRILGNYFRLEAVQERMRKLKGK
jgi:hypothetical protein